MHRRWLSRALIALAAPALTLPAFASSATAAESGAQVPGIDAVAEIYPHLAGGSANESAGKVYGPGKKCNTTKVIKGASQRSASYSPDYSSGDPDVYVVNGARPMVSVTAMEFPDTKAAVKYLHGYAAHAKKCPGGNPGGGQGPDCKTSMRKIKFSLGDERWATRSSRPARAAARPPRWCSTACSPARVASSSTPARCRWTPPRRRSRSRST